MQVVGHLRRNAVAYVALFLALSAGAYAAGLKRNSVGSKQIKANAVKEAELANGAVAGAKLADGAVGSAKLGDGSVTAQKLAADAVNGAKVGDGSLSGADVDENSLGAVPEAGNAGTVGGLTVKTFSEIQETPSPEADVVQVGGLTLSLACDGGSGVIVNARTSASNASLQSVALNSIAEAEAFVNDDDFDVGETVAVVPGAAEAGNLIGSLRYRTADEKVVTVEFATDAPLNDCQVWGTATGS